MKRMTRALLVVAGVSMSVQAFAYDPPASESSEATEQDRVAEELIRDQEAEAKAYQAASTVQVTELREGAGSAEPAETESDADRVERDFVTGVWNSP
jgi:hypothetical protein